MSKNILLIAAHPDDEVLGCGGTIARHAVSGDNIGVLYIADGVGARNDSFDKNLKKRKQAAENSLQILGARSLGFLDLPDNRLDSLPLLDIVQKIERVINDFQPNVVFTHHYGDLNIDHEIVHRATMTACRPIPGSSIKEIYAYEAMSSTEWALEGRAFVPNYFVDIEDFWDKKKNALEIYHEEMRMSPHTRSIKHLAALAVHRGNSVGLKKAEAFQILLYINS
jgi:LmbE family N-acetylglucosaminyl deacetylase